MPFCRWKGGNGPEQTDSIATGNLIKATPKSVKRFVLVTSAGVERFNKLPFSILNLFGMSSPSPLLYDMSFTFTAHDL